MIKKALLSLLILLGILHIESLSQIRDNSDFCIQYKKTMSILDSNTYLKNKKLFTIYKLNADDFYSIENCKDCGKDLIDLNPNCIRNFKGHYIFIGAIELKKKTKDMELYQVYVKCCIAPLYYSIYEVAIKKKHRVKKSVKFIQKQWL